jgi:hypothetical protein
MNISLAVTYHDPKGRLIPVISRSLPFLIKIFEGIAVRASSVASEEGVVCFSEVGGLILRANPSDDAVGAKLGKARKQAVELALGFNSPMVLYCDCDRILHWAEKFPEELADVLSQIPKHDFTVIGRTERAYQTHPRTQRDTEAIVNHLYSLITSQPWDVLAGTRGLSIPAAQAIIEGCTDEEITVDISWPLHLIADGRFSLGYIDVEGMEFETPDRYPQEIADAGGLSAWMDRIDSDPEVWLHRTGYIEMYASLLESYYLQIKEKMMD